jgi:hypothetical protein
MYGADEGIAVYPVRYGLVLKIGILLFLITFFLCRGNNGNWDVDSHFDEFNNQPINKPVTITVSSGVIAAHIYNLDNSNWHQVISDSTVSVGAEVKVQGGSILFTYENLPPGDSFWFETEEPCVVTIVAS